MRAHVEFTDLAAPPGAVWQVLTDLQRYDRWNRTITRASGEVVEGARLDLWLELGVRSRAFDPTVAEVRPASLLLLEKVLVHARVLRATHAFRLDPVGEGGTRLTQEWHLSGLLAAAVWPGFRNGLPAFARMGEDLAREVERGGEGPAAPEQPRNRVDLGPRPRA